MGYSLACGRLLASSMVPLPNNNSLCSLHHVSALATSEIEVCLPVKLHRLHVLLTINNLHLKFIKQKLTT